MMPVQFLDTTASASSTASVLSMIVPMAIALVLMYAILYLPQRRQDKKDAEMRNSIDIGDEVTTIGGIVGRVCAVKEDTFVLETSGERTKLRFRRNAIASVEKLDSSKETAKK